MDLGFLYKIEFSNFINQVIMFPSASKLGMVLREGNEELFYR